MMSDNNTNESVALTNTPTTAAIKDHSDSGKQDCSISVKIPLNEEHFDHCTEADDDLPTAHSSRMDRISPTSVCAIGHLSLDQQGQGNCSKDIDSYFHTGESEKDSPEWTYLQQPIIEDDQTAAHMAPVCLPSDGDIPPSTFTPDNVRNCISCCSTSMDCKEDDSSGVEMILENENRLDNEDEGERYSLYDPLEDDHETFDSSSSTKTWSYTTKSDGTTSVNPLYSAPERERRGCLFLSPSFPAGVTGNERRRVAFDDMMQVRYFDRTSEEVLDMRKFYLFSRRQIRRRRRESADWRRFEATAYDSDNDQAWWNFKAAVSVDPPLRDIAATHVPSIRNLVQDVMDDISDMISEVVVDANRSQVCRRSNHDFFRELDDCEKLIPAADTVANFFESISFGNPSALKSEETEDDEFWFTKFIRCGTKQVS